MFLNKELSVNGISLRGICVLRLELLLDEKQRDWKCSSAMAATNDNIDVATQEFRDSSI